MIRVATWNVNWFTRSAGSHSSKLAYLSEQAWDVLALQEVTPAFMEAIRASGVATACAYPVGSEERFACALLARHGLGLTESGLIDESPQPRRAVWAHVVADGSAFDMLSWHAPNAADRKNRFVKRDGYRAFVAWCQRRRGPLVVGTDANHGSFYTREEDFPGSPFKPFPNNEWSDENSFWTQADPDLSDVWLNYLANDPAVMAEVRGRWQGGPSAVSYVRGNTPDRFDYVLASPEFTVEHVAYDYEGGCAAGSDHAFLTAELLIR